MNSKALSTGKLVLCSICGRGGGTLRKAGEGYVHYPVCPPASPKPVVSKDELWKIRKPIEKEV